MKGPNVHIYNFFVFHHNFVRLGDVVVLYDPNWTQFFLCGTLYTANTLLYFKVKMGAQTNKYQKTKSRIYILRFVKVKQ